MYGPQRRNLRSRQSHDVVYSCSGGGSGLSDGVIGGITGAVVAFVLALVVLALIGTHSMALREQNFGILPVNFHLP